jgi:hypothetical protein
LLAALTPPAEARRVALPGNYSAFYPGLDYVGDWRFGELGADIPEEYAGASITLAFEGTDLALTVRRADYRGYLYVTIDGQPANGLPRDDRGAYLVLTSPEATAAQVTSIRVAAGLACRAHPHGRHRARARLGQWAFASFSVGRTLLTPTPAPGRCWRAGAGRRSALGYSGAACPGRAWLVPSAAPGTGWAARARCCSLARPACCST